MKKATTSQVLADFESLDEQQKNDVLQMLFGQTLKGSQDISKYKAVTMADTVMSMLLPPNGEHVFHSVTRQGEQMPSPKEPLIPFYISPGKYLTQYNQFWFLESLLGSDIIKKALKRRGVVDDQLIERLFSKDKHLYYLNQNRSYLLATSNELLEFDFGTLIPITALEALQQFGLEKMEEAKEKLYVRL